MEEDGRRRASQTPTRQQCDDSLESKGRLAPVFHMAGPQRLVAVEVMSGENEGINVSYGKAGWLSVPTNRFSS